MKTETPEVTFDDALSKFDNSVQKLADFFDISTAAVYLWKGSGDGLIPAVRAFQLVAEFPDLDSRKNNKKRSAA